MIQVIFADPLSRNFFLIFMYADQGVGHKPIRKLKEVGKNCLKRLFYLGKIVFKYKHLKYT